MAKKTVADNDYSFFKKLKTGDRYADANVKHPTYGFVDSGSYELNALLCGDIFGGFPMNRFVMAAGEQGSGKSFLCKNNFCKPLMDEGYYIYYYDTEGETTEDQLIEENGFDENKFTLVKEISTAEELFISINNLLNDLDEDKGKKLTNERKVAFVLDSQGGLTTNKAINDATKGELKQDMTKAKTLAAMYRSITNRCANLGIPMFITNHIYLDPSAYGDPKKVAGGEGAKFFASIILSMYKSFEKPSKDGAITGVVLQCTVFKSRLVKQKLVGKVYLDYKTGLNRYYGLHDIAEAAGLIEEWSASKYPNLEVPKEKNGQKTRKKCYVIKDPNKDPSQWLVAMATKIDRKEYIGTILEPINEYVKAEYKYRAPSLGSDEDADLDIDDADVEDAKAEHLAKQAAELESLRKGINGED